VPPPLAVMAPRPVGDRPTPPWGHVALPFSREPDAPPDPFVQDVLLAHAVARKREPQPQPVVAAPRVQVPPPLPTQRRVLPPPPPPLDLHEEGDAPPVRMEARVAPLWRRLGAWCVDLALISSVSGLFLWAATAMVRGDLLGPGLDVLSEPTRATSRLWLLGLLLVAAMTLLYLALFTALGGETPGKQLLGLRVIDRWGQAPSAGRSVVRAVLALGSAAFALTGFFLVLFDRRRQALHDKLSGTFVVLRRSIAIAGAPAVEPVRAG
jgi:uncharacterized RDD family membrane protein YckC